MDNMLMAPDDIEDTILVTHRGCLDGAGCAIMFINAGGKRENIFYVAPGQVEKLVDSKEFKSGRFMLIADIGLNDGTYSDDFERRGNLVLLDHHRSSLHLSGRSWCTIDMDACGTELTRRYLSQHRFFDHYPETTRDALRRFATLIDDHDRWILKDDRSQDLAKVMSFYGQKEFVEEFVVVEDRFYSRHALWNEFEDRMLDIVKAKCDEAVERALSRIRKRKVIIPTFSTQAVTVGYVLTSEENVSVLLAELLARHPDVDVACQINPDKNMVSLRSRKGGTDVSEFAGHFGGGGHASASGHPWPKGLIDMLIDEVHTSNVSRVENA